MISNFVSKFAFAVLEVISTLGIAASIFIIVMAFGSRDPSIGLMIGFGSLAGCFSTLVFVAVGRAVLEIAKTNREILEQTKLNRRLA